MNLSPAATKILEEVALKYVEEGRPGRYQFGFWPDAPDEQVAYAELSEAGLIEMHTVTRWRFTAAGEHAVSGAA